MTFDGKLSRRSLLRAGVLAGGGLSLGACSILRAANTPLPLYNINPQLTFDPPPPKVSWQLVISTPNADADLDTSRVALRRSNGVTEYFANAAWIDNAPDLVQSKMLEAFERTGSVAVSRDVGGLIPDYVLQSELWDFQAEYGGPVTGAHIRLSAKLIRMTDRKIVTTINAEQRSKATGTDMLQVVAAFQSAMEVVLKQIVIDTLKAVPAQP